MVDVVNFDKCRRAIVFSEAPLVDPVLISAPSRNSSYSSLAPSTILMKPLSLGEMWFTTHFSFADCSIGASVWLRQFLERKTSFQYI